MKWEGNVVQVECKGILHLCKGLLLRELLEKKFVGVDHRHQKEVEGGKAEKLFQGHYKLSLQAMLRNLDFFPPLRALERH